jgi:cell division septum initiation protein DivIVA
MRLEREQIERRDFDRVLRGYDPVQVHDHLHEISVAVADFLDRLGDANEELPEPVRLRLQAIVDSKKVEGEIERMRAQEEAERILADARRREGDHLREAADELSRLVDESLRRFERAPAPTAVR